MQSLQRVVDSILAADIGRVWTRVLLIDRVEGAYRVVAPGDAPTTYHEDRGGVLAGLRAAIQEIESSTGRHLLSEGRELIQPEDASGQGVDLLVVTTSAADPLKVAVGGLVERLSVASARRAAHSTYSELTHAFALDAEAGRWGSPHGVPGVVEQLLQAWPDAIVLTGGVEGGAERNLLELVDAVGLALQAVPDQPPPTVIYAGNSALQDAVQSRLGSVGPLMICENLRPLRGIERLRETGRMLEQQFRMRCLTSLPGAETLRAWTLSSPVPTAEALLWVVQFLALRPDPETGEEGARRVLGVDIGGGSAALAVTFDDRVSQTLVRVDLGLAHGAATVLTQAGADAVATWVPGSGGGAKLANDYANLALQPPQHPVTEESLRLLQGAAREVLRLLVRDARAGWPNGSQPGLLPPFDLILGCGRVLREAPRPEQALSILLDGLQPTGITHVLRDRLGLAPAIGALAAVTPQVAADLIAAQAFESLGVIVTPVGPAAPGGELLSFRLAQNGGVTEGVVEQGQSYRFPTPTLTELELHPAPQVDIGLGPGVGTTLARTDDAVGFVIDGRGRPLPLPSELQARRERVEEWLRYVGA